MTSAESSLAEMPPRGLWVQGAQTARLPWRFDTTAALAEVNALPASLWRTHFNEGRHDGGWQALALRSAPEAPIDVVPVDVAASCYADTPALDQCPTLRAMLDTMALPWKSVRLMQLLSSCEDRERMRERATRNGKQPREVFEPDTHTKHGMASDLLQSLTAQWIAPHHERLHAQRRSHPAAVTTQSEEALQ